MTIEDWCKFQRISTVYVHIASMLVVYSIKKYKTRARKTRNDICYGHYLLVYINIINIVIVNSINFVINTK